MDEDIIHFSIGVGKTDQLDVYLSHTLSSSHFASSMLSFP